MFSLTRCSGHQGAKYGTPSHWDCHDVFIRCNARSEQGRPTIAKREQGRRGGQVEYGGGIEKDQRFLRENRR